MSNFYSTEELHALGLAAFGQNVLISRKASLHGSDRIRVGSHVRIDDFCVLSAGPCGITIGDRVHVAVYTSLIGKGHIRLGDFVNLSSRVSVYSSTDDYSGEHMTNPMIPERFTGVEHADVSLCRHVIVGCGSVILPGVTLHDGAAIGALSLVNSDCESFGIYAGVPVKRIGDRSRQLLQLAVELSKSEQ